MKFSVLVEKLGDLVVSSSLDSNRASHSSLEIFDVSSIEEAKTDTISYIEGAKYASMVSNTEASALILPVDKTVQKAADNRGIAWIAGQEPRLIFAKTIDLFYRPYLPQPQIHPTATIDPSTTLGENVYIGAHATIDKNANIGNGVYIYPNTVIYPDVTIGDRTIIHANATIHERSRIGMDCVIHSGAVIGGEGFGFVPTAQGWYKMQQSGRVVLEDGVEVGSNSTIDRPAVGETRIKRQTKIDNLVQIGHGCQVGEGCAFAAQVGLAGGVKIGDRVILAGQVGIANQVKIGDGAIVSAKSGVHGDIEPKAIYSGYPAVPHGLYLKASAIYKKLPEIYQLLKKMNKNWRC
jgi:UDP-3-O-[3-hydroxymyristoyl] glucosamine N-acyltransferase